ncbi:MAG: glutamate--tRNA ligase [Salinivirgaceae bacterium]|jgi:glutamyl-tRNA synthetase|nr:glutamate--tRNA ligase [Salinivirgaceae bacterium]
MSVRVRFAPSPTGPLHIGGVRTALFNYLFAKKHNGKFILRIEDTDQGRYVKGAEDYIVKSLKWCGIAIDEGYTIGGDFEPYRQSERKNIYKENIDRLIDSGWAYYAFDTPEEIENRRKEVEQGGGTFIYNQEERMRMRNSCTLSDNEVSKLLEANKPFVVRFKMPENSTVEINDIIRGHISFNTNTLDDKVLFKSDGLPTYHLANIVDDHLMQISHVIRGEEWLPSLPLHVMLYKAFGWTDSMPEFAHLPLILKPTGKGKLSKRDGEKMGFPVFPLQWKGENNEVASGYKEDGYFPDAFVNMLALLGWNPGTEQEILSLDELINSFELQKVQKAGARFDPDKAKWFNHKYLQGKPNNELAKLFDEIVQSNGYASDINKAEKIVVLIKERVNFVHELWDQSWFFYQSPNSYDPKVVKKRWKNAVPDAIKTIGNLLEDQQDWKAEPLKEEVSNFINSNELGFGSIMNGLRLCIVGGAMGPDLFTIIELIGKEQTIKRINKAIRELSA